MKFASERQNSLILKLKSEFKGQIVSKFDLGLLNAYNSMYFDRNISENKDGKKNEGSSLVYRRVNYILANVCLFG